MRRSPACRPSGCSVAASSVADGRPASCSTASTSGSSTLTPRRRARSARSSTNAAPRRAAADDGSAAAGGDAHLRPTRPSEAVTGVDFVQESAPERMDLKRSVLAAAASAAGPDVADRVARPRACGRPSCRTAMLHAGTTCRRPSVQPGLPAAARRGRRRSSRRRAQRSTAPPTSTGRSACSRSCSRHGDRRLRRRPSARGAVARGALAGATTASRPSSRDRRRHPLRRRAALGVMGTFLDLPHRRRRGRHAPLHGPVRARPAVAVDEADGRPRS